MVNLLAFLVVASVGGAQDTATYRNPILNIEFEHPKAWQVSTSKKNESRILIPISGAKTPALLEILPVTFESEKDIWQIAQKTVVSNAKYELARQWEEDLLGVPMLVTRYSFPTSKGTQTAMSALLYSDWPRKLFFRLTTGAFEFEKAEFELRQALQTVRTIDKSAFKPNDPTVKPIKGRKVEPVVANPTKIVVIDGGGEKPVAANAPKGEVRVDARAAGRDLNLLLPKGWAATPDGDMKFSVRNPNFDGTLAATVASSLDGDPSQRALFMATNQSLNKFAAVADRQEQLPGANALGAEVSWVWRSGSKAGAGGGGFLATLDAVVRKGEFYFVISFETADKRGSEEAKRDVLAFLRAASIELKP